ncbi:multidrug effflux MFS transporter [Novosphingobium profundi]|uniref:multidrug effflux MFS transporter n=1 Tax=Novosphingobium profundi TaxID=1774954 RepID=UPI001BD93EF5|nr:multidrug effflux MFS transporter [Novosphingobium profundi]MBT0668371.1 multidrug effflux MFS transporter [Novosphingobium profundi]
MTGAHPQDDAFPMGQAEFVGLMAAMQALMSLSIDVMLPALGHISNDLGVSGANERQLVVGVFMTCAGIGSLFPGALADRFGRRRVVLFATAGNFIATFVCAISPSFPVLLLARGIAGLLTSAMMVMPMTILRDRYEGDAMARTQSLIATTFMVVPMIAPMVGQAIMLVAGWRWIFGVTCAMGVVVFIWAGLRLPETLLPENKQEIRPLVIVGNMRLALTERSAIGYFLGAAFVQAGLFGYLNSAQQLVGETLGAGTLFPVLFGLMALVMAGANFINARIVVAFGARRVSHCALFVFIVMGAIHALVAMSGKEGLWAFVVLMTISMCMLSFIAANFQAISLQPFARIAGAAASVMSFVRMVLSSLIGAAIGLSFDGTALPIAGSMAVLGVMALAMVLYSERGKLFRRINPPEYYRQNQPPKTPPHGG